MKQRLTKPPSPVSRLNPQSPGDFAAEGHRVACFQHAILSRRLDTHIVRRTTDVLATSERVPAFAVIPSLDRCHSNNLEQAPSFPRSL